jgi:hypothetical protein
VQTEQTTEQTLPSNFDWAAIDWFRAETIVRRLQERIYRATENQQWAKVKSLQKLLVKATSTKLLAIRRVTQENQGKHTPGIDGKVCDTPQARVELLKEGLSLKGYRPQPVRRVYIPIRLSYYSLPNKVTPLAAGNLPTEIKRGPELSVWLIFSLPV